MKKFELRLLAVAGILLAMAAVVIGSQTGGVVRVSTGPALSVSSVLSIDRGAPGNPEATTAPMITTIRAEPLNRRQAVWCMIRPDCDTMLLSSALGSADESAQMQNAVDAASKAADQITGPDATYPKAPGTGPAIEGIGGPSAGLSLTLYFVNVRSTGNLLSDGGVAATGTVTAAGKVGTISGIAYKARGAHAAGARVFFVPAAEADDVPPEPGMTVVPVTTADQAVSWLCAHGATSSACG